MHDMTLDRAQAAAYVAELGWDAFMRMLEYQAGERLCRRPLELYSVSMDWAGDPSIKVVKAKGARGDLLVALT